MHSQRTLLKWQFVVPKLLSAKMWLIGVAQKPARDVPCSNCLQLQL